MMMLKFLLSRLGLDPSYQDCPWDIERRGGHETPGHVILLRVLSRQCRKMIACLSKKRANNDSIPKRETETNKIT